jgi:hypothetical protein
MTETEWKWAIGVAIVVVIIVWRKLSARQERLRRVWFDGLASALNTTAKHDADERSVCVTTIEGRTFEIGHRYVGGQDYRPGWTLRCSTKLRGVSDIYNIRFRRKRDKTVEASIHGFAPREGWQSPALQRSLATMFENASRFDSVDLEGGTLMLRSPVRHTGTVLRAIITAQGQAADELERAL